VNVEAIARSIGAEVYYATLDEDVAGLVTRLPNGKPVIGINAADPTVRQRFSIAHEVAHLQLHGELLHIDKRFPLAFRKQSTSTFDAKEVEANQFAAELLMPQEFVMEDVQQFPQEEDIDLVVSKLANRYKVSVQAMTIRLTNLGLLS
jgi:Zn-dependent peptidase ImmA (M78 family)